MGRRGKFRITNSGSGHHLTKREGINIRDYSSKRGGVRL